MRGLLVVVTAVLLLIPMVQAKQILPFPPPPPPDLTFSVYTVTSPSVVHCGSQTIVFNVTETNLGAGPAAPYVTHHFANGIPFCGRQRPALAAGTSATYTDVCSFNGGPCDCPGGTMQLALFGLVDATGVVSETNEANNQSPVVIKTWACP